MVGKAVARGGPLRGLRRAVGLHIVDRHPSTAAHPLVWRVAAEDAFSYRWERRPVPDEVVRWSARARRAADMLGAARVRSWQAERTIASSGDLGMDAVNAHPGPSTSNSLSVALAVDLWLSGTPASARPWPEVSDQISQVPIAALWPQARGPYLVESADHLRRLISSWGPGAKGVVSVRRSGDPLHRVVNVVNDEGRVWVLDHSRSARRRWDGSVTTHSDAEEMAREMLDAIDPGNAFASLRLWRTADVPHSGGVPDDFGSLDPHLQAKVLDRRLPASVPQTPREAVHGWCRHVGSPEAARWLLTQVERGACTFLPGQFAALVAGDPVWFPTPLTDLDDLLVEIGRSGRIRQRGGVIDVVVPDPSPSSERLDRLSGVVVLRDPIDGVVPGTAFASLDSRVWDRVDDPDAQYQPPPAYSARPPSEDSSLSATLRPRGRRPSWIDANRGLGWGTRATNCWHSTAAVAVYLTDGAVSTSLPVNPDGPRPTLPEFLATVGATGPAVFVSTIDEADQAVRSWGDRQHGVVAAALNRTSTHLFNAYVVDGRVRYLDAHTGRDGAFNFDITWERIGVVHLGPMGDPGTWPFTLG